MNKAIEQKISAIIENTVNTLGFELVKVRLEGVNSKVLKILIDRTDHTKVSIDDCRLVSRNISALLDIEDIIADKYYLEVSSCGVDHFLVKFKDYVRFINFEAKIKLKEPINGFLKYQGIIIKAENNNIEFKINNKELVVVPFDVIKNACLVLTENMFKELLNKS